MRPAILLLALAVLPASAAAETVDVTGTWACSMSAFRSGAEVDLGEELFNIALYRTGRFAASGRLPDGTPYSAEGDWRLTQRLDGSFAVGVKGRRQVPDGIPTPIEFEVDYVGPRELSSTRTEFGDTISIDCAPLDG